MGEVAARIIDATNDRNPERLRLLFASPHCLLDFSSGAAVATTLMLESLARQGFQCHAYCAAQFDGPQEASVEQMLAQSGKVHLARAAPGGGQLVETAIGSDAWVPVSIFQTAGGRGPWQSAAEGQAFVEAYASLLETVRPQLLLGYGGDPVSLELFRMAKARGSVVVFLLHNLAYGRPETFAGVDHVVVPSEFARKHYREKLGLESRVLPCIIDPLRVEALPRQPQFVTMVSPLPAKGLGVFARIAAMLAERRPDIPFLLVEGRSGRGWRRLLAEMGFAAEGLCNLTVMDAQQDPRKFYGVTKLLLMPSLVENVGLVAAEAMLNGIPVLASNRGALPETIGWRQLIRRCKSPRLWATGSSWTSPAASWWPAFCSQAFCLQPSYPLPSSPAASSPSASWPPASSPWTQPWPNAPSAQQPQGVPTRRSGPSVCPCAG
jgi:glycosyltransferase involved in cell wall biosynthesis